MKPQFQRKGSSDRQSWRAAWASCRDSARVASRPGRASLVCCCAIGLLLAGAPARAEGESAEQLQRMYENAVAQLRSAQERRNELAKENEKLTASVADLEKRLADARADVASTTEKTFRLRAEYGAFQDFLRRYPWIDARWHRYLRQDMPADDVLDQLNSDWPFYVEK